MKKLIIFFSVVSIIYSQTIISPSTVGTAGTIATIARGDEVIGFNPANLGFEDNPEFSISFGVIPIVPIPSVRLVNDAVSVNWLADYLFSGEYLDKKAKDEMFKAFDNEGWNLNPIGYAKIIGISTGHFAFSIGAEVNTGITLPISLLRLAFYGNKFKEEINLDDINGSVQGVIPFSLAYGFPLDIPNLGFKNYLGFGVKLLWGVAHGEVVESEGMLTTYPDRIVGKGFGKYKYSTDGFGFAVDAGWSTRIGNSFTANIAIQNIFGSITWSDKNTEISETKFDVDMEVSDDFEDISDVFTNIDTTYAGKGYQSDYPTYMVVGFQYDPIDKIKLMVNYRQYFNEEYQFSTSPRISFGSELYAADWFPFRIGVSIGGFEKFQAGIGFGIHGKHYCFDIGITQTGGFFNSARGIGFAVGQKIIF